MKKRRTYSDMIKDMVRDLYGLKYSTRDISKELKIPHLTIMTWIIK